MSKNIKLSLTIIAFLSSLNASEQTIKLEPVTVMSATKTSQSLENLTSNINVITASEIQERHYTTVTQALNSIAGINYTSNGGIGSTTSINLRGASNNQTLVLIDGVRYQDPSSTSGASIQHLMIQDIAAIEVVKGAQSGIWGADASAGVINIITKEAELGSGATLNIEAGSFNTKKFGAVVSHKTSEYSIKLSANKITSDGFSVQSPKNEDIKKYEDDAYSNLTLNLKADYYISDNAKINFNVTDIDALKDYDSFGNPDDATLKSDISDRLYHLSYIQTYNNHEFTCKVEKSEFSRDEIGTVAQWGVEYVKGFEGEHTNVEFFDNIKYNERDFMLFGFGQNSDKVSYTKTDNFVKEKSNRDNFIYLSNSNNFDNVIFSQSVRYDDYNNFDSKATGKIGVKYNLNEDIYISSNLGLAYNVPNIVQELNPWGGVNSELNPEDTKSSDISIAYKEFKATYFYNVTTDLVEWYDEDGWSGPILAIYKNLDGESIFKGYEFEYSKNVNDNLLIAINYTKLSAKDKDGKNLDRKPKESLKMSFDYYPSDDLHIALFGEYIGERYDKKDNEGTQTGRYTVVNLAVNYKLNDNLSIYTKVDNVTDKYYQVVDGYTTSPLSAYAGIKAKF